MIQKQAFSQELLLLTLCYIYANGVNSDELASSSNKFDGEELTKVLKRLRVNDAEEIAGKITERANRSYATIQNEGGKLSVTRYDAVRRLVLRDLRLQSAKGKQLWPPTSQTIIARLGGRWSLALEQVGLDAGSDGKLGRANVTFSPEDRVKALRTFINECEEQNQVASYAAYTEWARESDNRVPSGASMRQIYGTWKHALEVAYGEDE
ncbi:hypothetical protein QS713_02815 [Gleimia hominis]|uniref:Uncharacterized protein n=1 Tax=Gleimia hominis TaxID=595468 RepID=A0ABU3I9E0_9ACTO|nr:hypothetical protein [Gleimia hominis]MDT3766997.1 hypothetical protein [Gleimia hominis]